jgi:hypothetical protein
MILKNYCCCEDPILRIILLFCFRPFDEIEKKIERRVKCGDRGRPKEKVKQICPLFTAGHSIINVEVGYDVQAL